MVEHKSLRPSEWNVWNEWMRAQRLMAQEIDTRLQDRFGISKADFSVLVTLSLSTESEMRAVDVANALGWEKSRLSHQLSRMERRGFVKRSESGAIGRRTGIALTSKGRGLAEQAITWHESNVRAFLLDITSPDQLAAIRAWSERVINLVESRKRTRKAGYSCGR